MWSDSREGLRTSRYFTSRLDAAGEVVEPYGRRYEPSGFETRALIASDGDDYLVVYPDVYQGRTVAQRLDENGSPVAAQRELPHEWPIALASDGTGYLLMSWGSQATAISLDRDGSMRGQVALQFAQFLSITVDGGIYTLIGLESGNRPVVQTIDARTEPMTVTATVLPPIPEQQYVAKASSGAILFAWAGPGEGSRMRTMLLDRKGNVLRNETEVNLPGFYAARILTDGNEFLLVSDGASRAVHIRSDGSLARAEPYVFPENAQLASSGDTLVLLWKDYKPSSGGDVVSRTFHRFDDLAVMPLAVNTVSLSGRTQDNARIARAGTHEMIVWRDETRAILGTIDGVEVTIDRQPSRGVGSPSVTAGGNAFLVAWNDFDPVNNTASRLLARRYALNGSPLDPAPIVLAAGGVRLFDDEPGVTADGASFVISDDAVPDTLRLLRLDGETGVSSELWTYECKLCRGSFRPVRTTEGWGLPYLRYVGFFSPHVAVTWGVSVAQTTPSGIPVRNVVTPLTGDNGYCLQAGVAQNGDQVSLALPQGGRGIQLVRTGAGVSPDPIKLLDVNDAVALDFEWNGSEYVLVWTTANGGPIRAMRFDASFRALDAAPITIAADGSTMASPSIAVTDRGVVIAYSRSTAENGWAPRAFTRSLDRLPPVPIRRRATRH